MSNVAPGAPSSALRAPSPPGEKGEAATSAAPLSPAGRRWPEGSDEGAPGATRIIKQDIRKHRPANTGQARQLRRNETEEEYHLWGDLRARRLNCYKFARQVPVGPFIVDFLCREERMIVEVDGFQDAESATDQRRTEWLNTNGYSVLRFWNQEISRERRWVLETILAALQGRLELSSELLSFYFASRFTDQG